LARQKAPKGGSLKKAHLRTLKGVPYISPRGYKPQKGFNPPIILEFGGFPIMRGLCQDRLFLLCPRELHLQRIRPKILPQKVLTSPNFQVTNSKPSEKFPIPIPMPRKLKYGD